ncbi:hypothetical protein NDU88_001169 [Pleurodeles waltl]|uniref:Uncharacterized protein n=1 Tax=Pleurodeles waltl TaxID=8319 RepID=A0AAV7VZN8_PLEWA|nr:hypothetical protein NDU88_001169 [Pleurodeles waltl]
MMATYVYDRGMRQAGLGGRGNVPAHPATEATFLTGLESPLVRPLSSEMAQMLLGPERSPPEEGASRERNHDGRIYKSCTA